MANACPGDEHSSIEPGVWTAHPHAQLKGGGRGPRGGCVQINVNVTREILNHRMLVHPHIIRFREVLL